VIATETGISEVLSWWWGTGSGDPPWWLWCVFSLSRYRLWRQRSERYRL